jgi:flagellar hook-length control protein FliK
MQAMIERIAEMPQPESGQRDAQIRLVPDALGPVDVKIEQRQDRLHVTLHAETQQARQLLSDAAPRLHELAEARGIRFAQTGFGGADPQDRRHAPDQHAAAPSRPRSADSAPAESDSQPDGDLIA